MLVDGALGGVTAGEAVAVAFVGEFTGEWLSPIGCEHPARTTQAPILIARNCRLANAENAFRRYDIRLLVIAQNTGWRLAARYVQINTVSRTTDMHRCATGRSESIGDTNSLA
ncbi:Uncharacterised protein [Mycobacteroides abscessus subsp. abscessus]|nr:Uncharacterised protein [Mycobacteroides abscessus subsp. abscessus]